MSMDNLKIAIEETVKATFGDNAQYILRNGAGWRRCDDLLLE